MNVKMSEEGACTVYRLTMLFRWLATFGLLAVALFASAASWDDDSHYVSLGPRNGYYIVRPDSHLIRQLRLYEAPVIDTPTRYDTAMARTRSRSGLIETAS
jgi:hypothetical protein